MNAGFEELRCLVAVVDHGGFTAAADELGVSQAAVSRRIAGLERDLGVRLLRRTNRDVAPTAAGDRVLPRARRLLTDLDDLVHNAQQGSATLRIGHAWATMGHHTIEFQRRWATAHRDTALHLVRTKSPTGGLAERTCDLAVIRTKDTADLADPRFDDVIVGLEPRYATLAADDALARRRQLRLHDLADRTLAVVAHIGITTPELWPPDHRPDVIEIREIDDWLDVIAAGQCFGITSEAAVTQYKRQGIVFRRMHDTPPVPVRMAWWRDDKHSATAAAVGLLAELYHGAG